MSWKAYMESMPSAGYPGDRRLHKQHWARSGVHGPHEAPGNPRPDGAVRAQARPVTRCTRTSTTTAPAGEGRAADAADHDLSPVACRNSSGSPRTTATTCTAGRHMPVPQHAERHQPAAAVQDGNNFLRTWVAAIITQGVDRPFGDLHHLGRGRFRRQAPSDPPTSRVAGTPPSCPRPPRIRPPAAAVTWRAAPSTAAATSR